LEISLTGKVALVTGGGAGIGRSIAETLGVLGAKIAVAEIDAAKIDELSGVLAARGIDSLVLQTDVRKTDQVSALMQAVDRRFGRLDILVNNVGHHLGCIKTLETMAEEEWDALYHINLRHLFVVTKAAIPLIKRGKRGGSIINVSSIEGFRGCPYNIAYTAFKHAVTGFTRAVAIELSGDGIRVNTIAPETTDSEQVPLAHMLRADLGADAARCIPLGRYGKPSDCAGAAVYLASDLSPWVTGTTIHVDGGGLAAGGFQRLPDGGWTIGPHVTGNVFAV
jgi:NAD(P)-dependent dehydrogenase (short-subunit alcohol dehydrogenase family)